MKTFIVIDTSSIVRFFNALSVNELKNKLIEQDIKPVQIRQA